MLGSHDQYPKKPPGEHIGLNRMERIYLAFEDVAGSIAQVYAIRFAGPVSGDAVRQALREVIRARPRLRGVVESRPFMGYHLRIRPDDHELDVLFDAAFRIEPAMATDDEALCKYMNAFLTESFVVGRDLLIKGRFLPNAEKPTLVLAIHHILGDGRSIFGWLRELHRVLNGERIDPVPLDPPGMSGGFMPRSLEELKQSIVGSKKVVTRPWKMEGKPIRFPRRPIAGFGPPGLVFRRVAAPLNALVQAARARKTTLGTLVFAAAAIAFKEMAPRSEAGPVRARFSVDLRDLYPEGRKPGDGNYVSSFFVDVDPAAGLDSMLPSIDRDVRAGLERFKERSMLIESVTRELVSYASRHTMGRVALALKARGLIMEESFLLTNVGRLEGIDTGKIQIDAVIPGLAYVDFGLGVVGFRGRLQLAVGFPRAEVNEADARAFLQKVDDLLLELVQERSVELRRHA